MDWRLHYPGAPTDGVKLLTRVITRLIPKRERKYDLEVVVAAILYRVSEGCEWRALEREILPWHVAYDYFRRWSASGVIEHVNALIVKLERRRQNRAAGLDAHTEPSAVVVDAQTVKSRVEGIRESLGYDGHKHVKGIGRHVATDLRGHVLACVCAPANDHESRWLKDVLIAVREIGFSVAGTVVADGGYTGKDADAATQGFDLAVVKRSDYSGAKSTAKRLTFKPLPRRWVIERTFGYLMHSRISASCYERQDISAGALVLWANIRVILRRWEKL